MERHEGHLRRRLRSRGPGKERVAEADEGQELGAGGRASEDLEQDLEEEADPPHHRSPRLRRRLPPLLLLRRRRSGRRVHLRCRHGNRRRTVAPRGGCPSGGLETGRRMEGRRGRRQPEPGGGGGRSPRPRPCTWCFCGRVSLAE